MDEKMELNREQWNEYLLLKKRQKEEEAKALQDYNKLNIDIPEDVMRDVPPTKRKQVVSDAKFEILQQKLQIAQQKLVLANSPIKQKQIENLRVNYRNYFTQVNWFKTLLNLDNPSEVYGKPVHKHELKFLKEKAEAELKLMDDELSLYGLTGEDLLRE